MSSRHSLFGPLEDVAADAGHTDPPPRVGFFTDTSICIGCKACEVACKEWNLVPDDGFNVLGMSFDNTGMLGADSWRHVAFVEQALPLGGQNPGLSGLPIGPSGSEEQAEVAAAGLRHDERGGGELGTGPVDLGMPSFQRPGDTGGAEGRTDFRWLMMSDVCKHCTHAGCLDVCPTGALFRTEFGTVVVQQDICNGCGYCVSGCPFGVIDRRHGDGRAQKCTLCYDRLRDGMEPACAKACPTDSIQFGPLDELRERARLRVEQLHEDGVTEARLYGDDPHDGVGGSGAFFLLLDDPEVYGLPPDPVVPTRDLGTMWKYAGMAAGVLAAAAVSAFAGGRGR
ncbi:4Fe-4S dicluster domain-containing protein [Streptomyces megasporus]|uniref:4Fe-4S dicluster domain-containing protein n=1 Tax=Streptomyces megasporus TaxID=44060 RepID=UPI0004E151F5|nr:4Fe-4S dicluster domain-containing protein [Streptomyces megasporus]